MTNTKQTPNVAHNTVYTPRSKQKSTRYPISMRESDNNSLENIRAVVSEHTNKIPSHSLIFRYGVHLIEKNIEGMNEQEINQLFRDMLYVSSDKI